MLSKITPWSLAAVLVWATAAGAAPRGDEIDYVELAARLLADGNTDRAALALRNVKTGDPGIDPIRYGTVAGLVEMRSEHFDAAVVHIAAAITALAAAPAPGNEVKAAERAESKERLHLYLGQAEMRRGRWGEAITAFESAGKVGDALAAVHEMRAQAFWELKDYAGAFAALDRGAARFPGDTRFARRKIFYLINLGFFQHAADVGVAYLTQADAKPADYVAIGSALRKSGELRQALAILERARLAFPTEQNITLELAHTYLELEQPGVAADLVAAAAGRNADLLVEAAELQRQAGRFQRALLLNTGVRDQQKKLRQRLSLFVSMERWELAATMGEALRRNKLLDEDPVRYAYAYALFKVGSYGQSDEVLGGIAKGEFFRKATALRKAMEVCRADRWRCK